MMPFDYNFDDLDLRVEAAKGDVPFEDYGTAVTRDCTRTEACTDSCCTQSC